MEMWLTRDSDGWCLWNKQPYMYDGIWRIRKNRASVIYLKPRAETEVCGIPLEVGGIARVKLNLRYLMEGEQP